MRRPSRNEALGGLAAAARRVRRRRRRYVADQDGHVLGLVPPARLGGQIEGRVPPAFLEHQMFGEAADLRRAFRIDADEAHRSSDRFAGVRVLEHGEDFEGRRHGLDLVAEKGIAPDLVHLLVRGRQSLQARSASTTTSESSPCRRSLSLVLKPAMTLLTTISVATPSMTLMMHASAR